MLLKVYSDNPSSRHLKIILEALSSGDVIIYPTDTVYAIGCDVHNKQAVERLCKIMGKKPAKADLSIICSNLSNLSEYTVPFETSVYKLMRKAFPGPYTFILKANSNVPKIFNKRNKRTIGIRVPDNNLVRIIVEEYGSPIVTASIKKSDDVSQYPTDPQEIYNMFKDNVDLIIDGGPGGNIASTVLDCTNKEISVIREGKGDLSILN